MPDTSDQARDFWDSAWKDGDDSEFWKTVAPEVVDLVRSQSPQDRPQVLDLGCGLGRNAMAFAQAGFHVSAVDLSSAAVSHAREWAQSLGLDVRTRVCDFLEDAFAPESFDIVLSYNVLYHTYREQVAQTIGNIRRWLRPRGIFYFTFPTRQDGQYGEGLELAPHTFQIEPGHMHYYADEADLDQLLDGFRVLARGRRERHHDSNEATLFSSRWRVLAEKA